MPSLIIPLLLLGWIFLFIQTITTAGDVLELHASGSTSASRLLWDVLDLFETRSTRPSRFTYRAVGSDVGQQEFIGNTNHYGVGEIPLSPSQITTIQAQGDTVFHIPIGQSSISIFHTIPITSNTQRLRLDPCVIARIFSLQITSWNDAAITNLNPWLPALFNSTSNNYNNNNNNFPTIQLVTRSGASGTNKVFSEFLKLKCPVEWTLSSGPVINWPPGTNGVTIVEGSDGVADFLRLSSWSIGYVESSRGRVRFLNEVAIKNKAGVYLFHTEANLGASASQAFSKGLVPTSLDSPAWYTFNLYDYDGPDTWPMVFTTFVLVRKSCVNLGLSCAFLKSILNFFTTDEAVSYVRLSGYSALPPTWWNMVKTGIQSMILMPGLSDVLIEPATGAVLPNGLGNQNMAISARRNRWPRYERSILEIRESRDGLRLTNIEQRLGSIESGKTVIGGDLSTQYAKLLTSLNIADGSAAAAMLFSLTSLMMHCCTFYVIFYGREIAKNKKKSGGSSNVNTSTSVKNMKRVYNSNNKSAASTGNTKGNNNNTVEAAATTTTTTATTNTSRGVVSGSVGSQDASSSVVEV
jgi:phosphate transport system substrate-binding protein